MYRLSITQTLVAVTVTWCLFSLPSCVLAPVNVIVHYLACVVLYPQVRLTWSGLASCVPDWRVLLQTRVYCSVVLLYCAIWWFKSGRERAPPNLKNQHGTNNGVRKNFYAWLSFTRSYMSTTLSQRGYCTLYDVQWMWYASPFRYQYREVPSLEFIRRWCGYAVMKAGLGKLAGSGVTRVMLYVPVRCHAWFWRVTSYHVRLHIRIWLYMAEWICWKLVPVAGEMNQYQDILQKNRAKFWLYKRMPLKVASRLWGRISQSDLPMWLRGPTYRLYIRLFGCHLEEAEVTELTHYTSLGHFFRRSLKPNLRPTDRSHCLTSPADGRVMYAGPVKHGDLEQVKGITYSLRDFLGQDRSFHHYFHTKDLKAQPRTSKQKQLTQITNIDSGQYPSDNTNHQGNMQGTGFSNTFLQMKRSDITVKWEEKEQCACIEFDVDISPLMLFSRYNEEKDNENDVANLRYLPTLDNPEETNNLLVSSTFKENIPDCQIDDNCPTQFVSIANACASSYSNIEEDQHEANPAMIFSKNKYHDPSTSALLLERSLLVNPGHMLHQCIVYLGPGDYHRFHSPADWTVLYRRHFTGELFSVNPSVASWLQGIFTLNERVMYVGRWQYGFFSFTAVGATNVGSIKVCFDKSLKTNKPTSDPTPTSSISSREQHFRSKTRKGICLKRGQLMGHFDLGSTIVLLFEAPADFKLKVGPNQRVKYGQGLVSLDSKTVKARNQKRRRKRICRV